MIPISDDNPTHSYPVVNHLLIAANIAVFAWQFFSGAFNSETVLSTYCFVPTRFLNHFSLAEFGTFFSAMFMHAGFAHLFGNMLYLFIFGDNVEDRMGKGNYLLFYLSCGILAALTHILVYPTSSIPSLGASGAIAGVLAAYLILFPGVEVQTWVTWYFRPKLPAWVLIGVFFAMNCLYGLIGENNGVGWFAHIGGFIGGILLLKLVMRHAEEPGKNLNADISQSPMPLMATVVIALYGIGVVGYAIYPHLNFAGKPQAARALPTANKPNSKPINKPNLQPAKKEQPVAATTNAKTHKTVNHPHKLKAKAKGPSEKSPH